MKWKAEYIWSEGDGGFYHTKMSSNKVPLGYPEFFMCRITNDCIFVSMHICMFQFHYYERCIWWPPARSSLFLYFTSFLKLQTTALRHLDQLLYVYYMSSTSLVVEWVNYYSSGSFRAHFLLYFLFSISCCSNSCLMNLGMSSFFSNHFCAIFLLLCNTRLCQHIIRRWTSVW